MEKKFKKVSLPLSALMATLITGTAWADFSFGSDASGIQYVDAHKITDENIYKYNDDENTFNFNAGTLNEALIEIYPEELIYNKKQLSI